MIPKDKFASVRIVRIKVVSLFLLNFIFLPTMLFLDSKSAATETPTSNLVVIADLSKSMSGQGLEIVTTALETIATNEDLVKKTTLITYPNNQVFTSENFRNSTELEGEILNLKTMKGYTDLRYVFEMLQQNIENAPKDSRWKILWITDGGSVNSITASSNLQAEMSKVLSIENWTVVNVSDESALEGILGNLPDNSYQKLVSNDVGFFKTYIERFWKIEAKRKVILNESPSPLINSLIISLILGFFAAYAVFVFFVPLIEASRRKIMMKLRQQLIEANRVGDARASVKIISSNRIWTALPRFFTQPVKRLFSVNSAQPNESTMLLAWFFGNVTTIFVLFLIFRNLLFAVVLGLILFPVLTTQFSKRRENSQRSRFAGELPVLLMLISSGLKAGLSLEQNLDAYCQQNSTTVAREFRRVLSEVSMGNDLDKALDDLALRMKNEDLDWLVTAIKIQKSVGGSLSSIIDTVLETIRGRMEIKREVRSLASEGKLSAYVLIALPVFIFLFLLFTRRDYVQLLWTDPLGYLILITMGLLVASGSFWMSKVVNIKV